VTDQLESPASPCVRNCCLDGDDVCMGCNRTLREICDWHTASAAEKIEVLTRCRARAQARLDPMHRKG
jgi:predicted Fe-S protein YdhL (DUF1289 family)